MATQPGSPVDRGSEQVNPPLHSVGNPPSAPISDGVVTLRLPVADDVARLAYFGSNEALLEGIWVSGGGPGVADPLVWAAERLAEFNSKPSSKPSEIRLSICSTLVQGRYRK